MKGMKKIIILAVAMLALISCQKEKERVRASGYGFSLSTERGIDSIRSYGLKYVEALKELTSSEEFVNLVKSYYEDRVGDSMFNYVVSLEELGDTYEGDFEELLSSSLSGDLSDFVIDSYRGIEVGGKILKPELFIFYYAPEFRELSGWDGRSVEEVVYNYEVNGKFYGYRIDGSVVEYSDIDGRLLNSGKWVLQWGNERGFLVPCHCRSIRGSDPCSPGDNATGDRWCGVAHRKWLSCIGFCLRDYE